MPTRYFVAVTSTRTVRVDVPDSIDREQLLALLDREKESLLEETLIGVQILESREVSLREVRAAPPEVLRVSDSGMDFTYDYVEWVEGSLKAQD
jgi:hypothetical protein